MLNHFEENSFERQLFFAIKFNISSQNVLKVLQFYMKFKVFINLWQLVIIKYLILKIKIQTKYLTRLLVILIIVKAIMKALNS
jgi:hypothetical protein